ncbi:glycosyltransferase [Radiobacillus deserti]|uniref:Glycosyltransferase n=1 Tax=Radiobacillus deserti TaxID=2594883 RepID=A0A516KIQ2_9BACI|nr:glycosyltransferase [Radiobacillus deserti]QDP41275.1 glycosyltransferase [Radiobacillus deserti]
MISVIMPVYNASPYLKESIDSILNQTEPNFELIIVNDGSTDNSEEIILGYKDSRIAYYKQKNSGGAAARNLAFEKAKGDFIVFQDADDVSLLNRFELLKRQFISDEIGFVHSDMLLIDDKGKTLGYWQARQVDPKTTLRHFLKKGTAFNNASIMLRKDLIKSYYDVNLKIGEDTDFITSFAFKWHSIHVDRPLLLYRRHTNNVSTESNYDTLYSHVQKMVKQTPLEELIPEINWESGYDIDNELRAKCILALLLLRRGMIHDAQRYLKEVVSKNSDSIEIDTKKFILAFSHLMKNNLEASVQSLEAISIKDHIVYNYLGEIFAYKGRNEEADNYFMKSLFLSPMYVEPLDNLKSLGASSHYSFTDNVWSKYKT